MANKKQTQKKTPFGKFPEAKTPGKTKWVILSGITYHMAHSSSLGRRMILKTKQQESSMANAAITGRLTVTKSTYFSNVYPPIVLSAAKTLALGATTRNMS